MKSRSAIRVLLLCFASLGLYELYWTYATHKEMTENKGIAIPDFVYYLFTKLVIWIMIIPIVLGENSEPQDYIMLILFAAMTVNIWWLWQYSKAAEQVTKGKLSRGWCFFFYFVADSLAPAIIQRYFNDVPDKN